jgi:adhesin isopeptide-forming family sspB-C2 type protein/LPXTG-motif cell wall-anchored protein
MTSPVRADERVNPNPATNAKSLQDSPTVDSTKDQGSAEKSTGSVEVTVNREKVESAVSAAKEAGLIVKETEVDGGLVTNPDVLANKTAEIESNYDKQASTVVDESKKYREEVANRKEEIKTITTENKEKQDSYNKAKDQYDKDLAEYNRQLEEYNKQTVRGQGGGVKVVGEFDESKRGSLGYYSKLTALFDVDKDLELPKGSLGATSATTLTLDKGFVEFREKYTSDVPKYGGAFIKGFEQGNKFTLHNIGETTTGKKISATFTVRKTPTKEFDFDYSPSRSWIWWYKNGEAGPVSPIGFAMGNTLNVEWDINFFDEVTKKPIKLGVSNIFADLDYKQSVRYTYDDPNNLGVVVNAPTSHVVEKTVRGEKVWMGVKNSGDTWSSDDNSGLGRWHKGDTIYENALDEKDTPIGTVLSIGKGYTHHLTYLKNGDWGLNPYSAAAAARYKEYVHAEKKKLGEPIPSDYDLYESGYQFLLWGSGTSINALTPLTPPTADLKPVPNEVEPREVEVTYTRLRTTPTVEKLVKNSAGTNVNNSSVPKLSEVVWELETKPLAANRKETTIYELTDNLPQGYLLDLAKTVDQNQDFTVTYDKDKHQLKGLLKAEGLAKVNTDLSKAYKAPVLKVYGTVTNDGATYKNNFHLNLNNEFESYSNIVKVTTPGKPNDPDNPNNNLIQPLKHNYNKDKVIIDGKPVLAGSTNYYQITLDYDQYKGMKADSSTILKGFGAIDDYPEEAVTTNQSDIRYIDSEGKEVSGISVYQYDSIDSVDNDKVKAFLASSEIKPKGAFQVFLVDDPEAYFNQYIKSGKSVTIINPMVTKEELRNSGKSFENTAYQVDFGNGYQTDTVVNNVPTVKSTKKNLNKAGVNIGGKQVLAGSVNYYTVTADYSQYKGIEADKDSIGKGFYIVDDYPEEAVTINQDGVQVTDSKGQVVKGLKMALYESLDKAPTGVQEAMKSRNFTPKGAIQVFEAENPEEFYKTYVQAGEVLTITNPMTVKKELGKTGGKYENTAYQLDFGSAYVTETVVNNVPKIEPKKDVVIDHLSKESLDGKEVKLNQTFNYKLVGSLIPKDRSEQLFEYKFRDDYDETHDDYQSIYQVFAAVDFETSDGQKFKAGDELTKFTSQVVDKAKGKVDISFDDAFLKSILETSEFQAEVYLQMTRIQSGTVENTYSHTVNGVEVVSNTVVTHTPEEPKPQEPKKPSLPNTGTASSMLGYVGSGILSMLGLVGIKRKKD